MRGKGPTELRWSSLLQKPRELAEAHSMQSERGLQGASPSKFADPLVFSNAITLPRPRRPHIDSLSDRGRNARGVLNPILCVATVSVALIRWLPEVSEDHEKNTLDWHRVCERSLDE